MGRRQSKNTRKKTNSSNLVENSSKNSFSFLKKFLFISTIIAILAVPAVALIQKHQVDHDLSVIGNGMPVVVQVHDPGCQYCRRLKKNVDSVKSDYLDNIHFKIADITGTEGANFASRYNVPHVTLLLFDGNGNHRRTLQGVSTPEEIQRALNALVK